MYGNMDEMEQEASVERRLAELEMWRHRVMNSIIKIGPFAVIAMPLNDLGHRENLDAEPTGKQTSE